jgi:alpha-ketoglutarate-dependent taurine dioxygenase
MDGSYITPDTAKLEELRGLIEERGWLLIEGTPEAPRAELLALRTWFGDVVGHQCSDGDGIVSVDGSYRPPRAMLPHTDGSYEPEPPAVMCLQCVHAAESGGVSTLVDGARLYALLAREYPEDLPVLFTPVLRIGRGSKYVERALFSRVGGRTRIRFRVDETVDMTVAAAAERVVSLVQSFLEGSGNWLHLALRPGQILVTDNFRVLHGRTAYDGREPRQMQRLWLNGEPSLGPPLRCGIPRL